MCSFDQLNFFGSLSGKLSKARFCRYSVKLMYDRVAMGMVDMAADESHDDIVTSLQEYDSSWCICPETSVEWKNALKLGVPSLYSISRDPAKVIIWIFSTDCAERYPCECRPTALTGSVDMGWTDGPSSCVEFDSEVLLVGLYLL